MKRHLLTIAVAAATLLPLAAQAEPKVYGRLNLSIDYSDVDTGVVGKDGKVWEVNSNSSRFGVKGSEKLNETFTAVYKAEWAVNGDVGGADLAARERYLGLKHFQWGTVRLGHIDSPFKNAEDDIDVFNDSNGLDMQNFIYGQKNRLQNSINYVSPKFLDVFGANITLQPGEQPATNINENHIADAISAAFSYEDDNLYLSAAMDKEVVNMDAIRLNARYKMGDATVSAMYQTAEPTALPAGVTNEETAFVVSGSYKMDAITIKGEVLMANHDNGGGNETDKTLIGGGVDYNFTQNTKVYGYLAVTKAETTVNVLGVAKSTDTDGTYLGVGMETRF